MIISLFNKFCSQAFSMVIFAIRSSACTFSSVVLLVFYIVQLFLRILKIMYAAAEWTLMYACSMVNDVSLLLGIDTKTYLIQEGDPISPNLRISPRYAFEFLDTNYFECVMNGVIFKENFFKITFFRVKFDCVWWSTELFTF